MIQLLSTEGFNARAACGPSWTPLLILVCELSNMLIFMCYCLIPFGCIGIYRRLIAGGKVSYPKTGVVLFAGFIATCGLTHFMDRLMFQWPAYRLTGLVLAMCAAFSVSTVAWLIQALGATDGGISKTQDS